MERSPRGPEDARLGCDAHRGMDAVVVVVDDACDEPVALEDAKRGAVGAADEAVDALRNPLSDTRVIVEQDVAQARQ